MKLMAGRYGPYVTDGQTNASLARGETPEEVTLERALALLADRAARGPAPKAARRKGATKGATKGAKRKAAKK